VWHIDRRIWANAFFIFFAVIPADAAFEVIGLSARTVALGYATIAEGQDATGIWGNPAKRETDVNNGMWSTTHGILFPGIDEAPTVSSLTGAIPFFGGIAQLGWSSLNSPLWSEQVAVLGFGRSINSRFSLGGSVLSANWSAGSLTHRGWDGMLGMLYEVGWILPRVYMRIGLSAENILSNSISIAAGGVGRRTKMRGSFSLNSRTQRVLFGFENSRYGTLWRIGYEIATTGWGMILVRSGITVDVVQQHLRELSLGFGHKWRRVQFDYALVYNTFLQNRRGSHWVTIGFK